MEVFTNPESIFYFNPTTAVWTLLTFGVLFVLIWKFGWKPIIDGIQKRDEQVKNDVEKAKSLKEDVEALKVKQEKVYLRARTQAADIVSENRADSMRKRNKLLNDSRDSSRNSIQNARDELNQAKDKAMIDAQHEIADLVALIAGKVLGDTLQRAVNRKTIDEVIQTKQRLK